MAVDCERFADISSLSAYLKKQHQAVAGHVYCGTSGQRLIVPYGYLQFGVFREPKQNGSCLEAEQMIQLSWNVLTISKVICLTLTVNENVFEETYIAAPRLVYPLLRKDTRDHQKF